MKTYKGDKTSNAEAKTSAFEKRGECLYRYKPTGTYYAFYKVGGNKKRQSLDTKDEKTAKRLLADKSKDRDQLDHSQTGTRKTPCPEGKSVRRPLAPNRSQHNAAAPRFRGKGCEWYFAELKKECELKGNSADPSWVAASVGKLSASQRARHARSCEHGTRSQH